MISVLYFHDKTDWSLHNVGKLWLSGHPEVSVTFAFIGEARKYNLSLYNFAWFGYLHTHFNFEGALKKAIVSVHDPIELDAVSNIRYLKNIVTASKEMQSKLRDMGIEAFLIPTAPHNIPYRENFCREPVKLFTINSGVPKKNNPSIQKLFSECQQRFGISNSMKIGYEVLSETEYLNFLDSHNIFVCMSSAEGGSIPAMEAMNRGSVVFSTGVGQMPELIEDGVNGFLLSSYDAFLGAIQYAFNNPEWFFSARQAAVKTMQTKRDIGSIKNLVYSYLQERF